MSWYTETESAVDTLGEADFAGCSAHERPCDNRKCSALLYLGDDAIVAEDGDAFCSEECLEADALAQERLTTGDLLELGGVDPFGGGW